jgi:phosphoglycerate dehydrogenase-like enzyme
MRLVIGMRLPATLLAEVRAAAGAEAEIFIGTAEAELLPSMPDAEVMLAGTFTPGMLAVADRLRWVHSTGAGVERLLFPELVESSVTVTNARSAHRVAMPEYVLMAMLSWTHHLPTLVKAQGRREWIKPVPDEVWGKTLGLLGYGEIGRAVAERAGCLGVRCLAYRRHPERAEGHRLVERVYGPDELHAFLAASDFVVNSLPLTGETHGVIGEAELRAMGPKSVLIHLGRGPTVQQEALLRALREGQIAGAFLDVFDEEPLAVESPFWELENVIVTSHTSGNSTHYLERSIDIFCENLGRHRAGEPLRNVVDKRLGY